MRDVRSAGSTDSGSSIAVSGTKRRFIGVGCRLLFHENGHHGFLVLDLANCKPPHPFSFPEQLPSAWRQVCRHSYFVLQRPTIPSMGLLAVPYSLRGIRPARYANRPARTASFIASAIAAGSC